MEETEFRKCVWPSLGLAEGILLCNICSEGRFAALWVGRMHEFNLSSDFSS